MPDLLDDLGDRHLRTEIVADYRDRDVVGIEPAGASSSGWAISIISIVNSRSKTKPAGTRSGSDSIAMPASMRSS
jgi:hypothetical protein